MKEKIAIIGTSYSVPQDDFGTFYKMRGYEMCSIIKKIKNWYKRRKLLRKKDSIPRPIYD
jgi:hypothetical protein